MSDPERMAIDLAIKAIRLIHSPDLLGKCMACKAESPCGTRRVINYIPQWTEEYADESEGE